MLWVTALAAPVFSVSLRGSHVRPMPDEPHWQGMAGHSEPFRPHGRVPPVSMVRLASTDPRFFSLPRDLCSIELARSFYGGDREEQKRVERGGFWSWFPIGVE